MPPLPPYSAVPGFQAHLVWERVYSLLEKSADQISVVYRHFTDLTTKNKQNMAFDLHCNQGVFISLYIVMDILSGLK